MKGGGFSVIGSSIEISGRNEMTGERVVITHNENGLIQKGFVIVPNAKGSMLLDGCNFYTDDVSNFIIHNQAPGFHIEMDNCHVTKYGTNWW